MSISMLNMLTRLMCFQFVTNSVSQSRVQHCLHFGLYLRNIAFHRIFYNIQNICFVFKMSFIFIIFAKNIFFVIMQFFLLFSCLPVFLYVKLSDFQYIFCLPDSSLTSVLWTVCPCCYRKRGRVFHITPPLILHFLSGNKFFFGGGGGRNP